LSIFKEKYNIDISWVLIPYSQNGKILNLKDIEKDTYLFKYLSLHKKKLSNRKGVLINSKIGKGFWWVMLGVDPYNFFKYKIIWEAYGRDTFKPKIFTGRWQPNQSLQAFIPFQSKKEANRVVKLLKDKKIEEYLKSSRMSGIMNLAQLGRIKNLIEFDKESPL